jgi:hypothetical protein
VNRQGIRLILWVSAAALIPACGGSSGGGGKSPIVVAFGPPAHPFVTLATPGAATIKASGGVGSTGKGGNGGMVSFRTQSASDMWLLKNGSIDSSFPVNPVLDPYLGLNPRTIDVDTTLSVGTGLFAGGNQIYGDDGLTAATSLWVKPGVTLTLDPNFDTDNADGDANSSTGTFETTSLTFFWTVFIEGTVRTGLRQGTPHRSHLTLNAAIFVARPGAVLDLGGADSGAGSDGANGGNLYILTTSGITNEAPVTTKGGNGDNGGTGGSIEMYSGGYSVINTADLTSSGGTGNSGKGGRAGFIWLTSSYNPSAAYVAGGTFNSGNISARGGNGTTGGGGGNIILSVYHFSAGPFVSTGTVDASGGDATVDGDGGDAGGTISNGVIGVVTAGMWLVSEGGSSRIAGTLRARGGNGAGSGNGGKGGRIECSSNSNSTQPVNGGFYMAASWDTRGGDGAVGGDAGACVIWNSSNWQLNAARMDDSPTYILGVASIDTHGGAGQTDGGTGGIILLTNNPALDAGGNPVTGSLLNEADLTSTGGSGTTGIGADGGRVYIGGGASIADFPSGIVDYVVAPKVDRRFVNYGTISMKGGDGGTTGGVGGRFQLIDFYHVENYGAVDGSGGNGGTGNGGRPGGFVLRSEGITINQANLTANGGDSASGAGGAGADEGGFDVNIATIDGRTSTTTGNLSSRGGNSTSGAGGRGGIIVVSSWDVTTPSVISGTLSVQGGTGATAGTVGQVRQDGIDVPLIGGSKTY